MGALVIGLGSIGERHLQNLLSLGISVSVFDLDQQRAREISRKYSVPTVPSLDSVFSSYTFIFICTPTHTHVELAAAALGAGCHVFIEKPIAEKKSADLAALVSLANSSEKLTLVGCNMRFHPGIREIKTLLDSGMLGRIYGVQAHIGHYLPNWRKTDYKKTYSARSDQGGGILLESIHEFDYLRWLFGDVAEISARTGRSGALDLDGEDLAEVTLLFQSGIVGHLHADCLQQMKRRGCEIIAEKGTFHWESVGKNPEMAVFTLFRRNGEPIERRTMFVDPNEPYLAEMKYFLETIKQGGKTMNDVAEAAKTLHLVEMAKGSAKGASAP